MLDDYNAPSGRNRVATFFFVLDQRATTRAAIEVSDCAERAEAVCNQPGQTGWPNRPEAVILAKLWNVAGTD